MPLPAGILKNMKTRRFHPIVFRPWPKPSGDGDVVPHESTGHHPTGFETIEAARTWLAEDPDYKDIYKDSGRVWEWCGDDTPAITCDFSLSKYGNAVQAV